ncbi:MAG: tRNA (adenosine(37)-N6)-threonylcarbamoyltransferase complex dimerization subunit type 1 TsaB, partial [Bacteroidota bacterium]
QDGRSLSTISASEPFQHAAMLNVYIQQALEEAHLQADQLDIIGLSQGPGSYTSLRVGAAMAKGMVFALPGLKLYPLLSLRALARSAYTNGWSGPLISTQNSRRDEVYACLFNDAEELERFESSPKAMSVDDSIFKQFFDEHPRIIICGSGSNKLTQALGRPEDVSLEDHLPIATHLGPELDAVLGTGAQPADIASFEPLYLKPPFVTIPKKRSLL